jgi:hypothetical protein
MDARRRDMRSIVGGLPQEQLQDATIRQRPKTQALQAPRGGPEIRRGEVPFTSTSPPLTKDCAGGGRWGQADAGARKSAVVRRAQNNFVGFVALNPAACPRHVACAPAIACGREPNRRLEVAPSSSRGWEAAVCKRVRHAPKLSNVYCAPDHRARAIRKMSAAALERVRRANQQRRDDVTAVGVDVASSARNLASPATPLLPREWPHSGASRCHDLTRPVLDSTAASCPRGHRMLTVRASPHLCPLAPLQLHARLRSCLRFSAGQGGTAARRQDG